MMRTKLAALLAVLLLLAIAAPTAMAAASAQDAPGESNLGFLLAGTLLTWAGFFAYAFYISRKNRDLRREIEELQRLLDERGGDSP